MSILYSFWNKTIALSLDPAKISIELLTGNYTYYKDELVPRMFRTGDRQKDCRIGAKIEKLTGVLAIIPATIYSLVTFPVALMAGILGTLALLLAAAVKYVALKTNNFIDSNLATFQVHQR
jgi:hypothetical protein